MILFYYLLALLWVWVYMSCHVIAIDIDVYSVFAVIFNILCLEVAYDSMRLFHWYLHYIYDLILYLCTKYYTVCYLTGIVYAVVRQISVLFIDNKISVFCILLNGEKRWKIRWIAKPLTCFGLSYAVFLSYADILVSDFFFFLERQRQLWWWSRRCCCCCCCL